MQSKQALGCLLGARHLVLLDGTVDLKDTILVSRDTSCVWVGVVGCTK